MVIREASPPPSHQHGFSATYVKKVMCIYHFYAYTRRISVTVQKKLENVGPKFQRIQQSRRQNMHYVYFQKRCQELSRLTIKLIPTAYSAQYQKGMGQHITKKGQTYSSRHIQQCGYMNVKLLFHSKVRKIATQKNKAQTARLLSKTSISRINDKHQTGQTNAPTQTYCKRTCKKQAYMFNCR